MRKKLYYMGIGTNQTNKHAGLILRCGMFKNNGIVVNVDGFKLDFDKQTINASWGIARSMSKADCKKYKIDKGIWFVS